jgi:hypothetical protein
MAEPILKLPRGIPKTDREWMDVFSKLTKHLRVEGDRLILQPEVELPASAANSVFGRAASTPGVKADIVAGSDGTFLKRTAGTLSFTTILDSDIPSSIARDAEVAEAITAHEGASNPHPDYTTAAELSSAIATHAGAADPHPGYTTAAELASAISALNLASGTYTPTVTGVTNVASVTAYLSQYMRVGSVVTVSGRIDVDPTAAVATQVGISLPIASDFTAASGEECGGVAYCQTVAGFGAAVYADVTNNRAQMEWIAVDTAARSMWFTFTYRIA